MVEAAPTGWLGVGRPVGPPVPWPRAMHRALPAPGRGFGSPTPRGVPSTVFGALDAGAAPRLGPAGSGWGTLLVRASTSMIRLLGRVDRASHRSPAVLLVEALHGVRRSASEIKGQGCQVPFPLALPPHVRSATTGCQLRAIPPAGRCLSVPPCCGRESPPHERLHFKGSRQAACCAGDGPATGQAPPRGRNRTRAPASSRSKARSCLEFGVWACTVRFGPCLCNVAM